MAITFRNYFAQGQLDTTGEVPVGQEVELLVGGTNGTVVKSLEVITGNESCYVEVIRRKSATVEFPDGEEYARIKLDMKAYDYLVLWEGFFVIPQGHRLTFIADSESCRLVANAVLL